MNSVEPYAYLRDLFISIANGYLAKDIDALMPWAYAQRISASKRARQELSDELTRHPQAIDLTVATEKSMGWRRRIRLSLAIRRNDSSLLPP